MIQVFGTWDETQLANGIKLQKKKSLEAQGNEDCGHPRGKEQREIYCELNTCQVM